MDFKSQLADLKIVASKLLIEIQYHNLSDIEFKVESGFCQLNGKLLIIIDKQTPECNQVNIIIETLSLLNLENIYLSPWIRERLEQLSLQRSTGK